MKSRVELIRRLMWSFAAILYCMPALAAQPPKPAAPAPAPKTEVVEPETSNFVIPRNPKEGRDPFFPNSTIVSPQVTKTTAAAPVAPPKMTLMGISGPREKHLAIINGHTFSKGEEQDVSTASGKVHVRCLEIKEESVIIDVNGERQELRLRSGL